MESDSLAIIVLIAFLIVFGGGIGVAWRGSRRDQQKRAELAQALGFYPLPNPDESLRLRLIALHRRKNIRDLKLRNVFTRTSPDGQMLLYDLEDTGEESFTEVASRAVAMVLPGRSLPRLALLPRPESEGRLARWAEKVMDWSLDKTMQAVELPDQPEFERHFRAASEDPARARQVLTPELCNLLVRIHGVGVEMGGEMLGVTSSNFDPAVAKIRWDERVRWLVDAAQKIARLL